MSAQQLDALPRQAPPAPRAELLRAREMLSGVYELLDQVGPGLPELERTAVLTLRGECSSILRRLTNIVLFMGSTS